MSKDVGSVEAADETSVRDFGFRAASEVVERFISSMGQTDPRIGSEADPRSSGGQRAAFRQLRADLARAVDANLDLVRRAFDLYAGAVDRLLGNASAPDGGGEGSHLKLPPVLAGHRASSTLWVHNTTPSASPALILRASDLVSHTGETIRSDGFEFEPAEIDIAPPNSSVAVAVGLAIDPAVLPGRYRGYVFVTNLPDEFMTIEVEVVGAVGESQEDRWRVRRQAS
jgi:hypothetical protein